MYYYRCEETGQELLKRILLIESIVVISSLESRENDTESGHADDITVHSWYENYVEQKH